jgi:hypothetical protein
MIERIPHFRVLGVAACLLLPVGACASGPDDDVRLPPESVGARKQRMILATESSIQRLLGLANQEIERVRTAYEEQLDSLQASYRLSIVDDDLENYGTADLERFRTRVEELEERTTAAIEELLARYDEQFWYVATEIGHMEKGTSFGYRTGYRDLDEKVEAALIQLAARADLEGIHQSAAFLSSHRLVLSRKIRHEVEGVGEFDLFVSSPEEWNTLDRDIDIPERSPFRRLRQSYAMVVTFRAADDLRAVPFRFVQAVRHRIERGGIVIEETDWRLDPSCPGGEGILALREEIAAEGVLASVPTVPHFNAAAPGFDSLRRYTLVSEYRTALQRSDRGEILSTLAWQIVWRLDARGQIRVVLEECAERVVDGDGVIESLQAAATEAPPPEDERVLPLSK